MIVLLYFLITAVISQNFIYTAELAIPTIKSNAEIVIYPAIGKTKTVIVRCNLKSYKVFSAF